jgi:predicted ester cyclase
VKELWEPLKQSFTRMKRREDVFMAGDNSAGEGKWVMSMGHFAGLFDKPFLGIRSTGKLAFLRYAEFFEVREDKIVSHAIFFDLIALMQQVGLNPLPVETGHTFVYPGPCDHNGLLFEEQDPQESKKTIELVEEMVKDLKTDNGLIRVRLPLATMLTFKENKIVSEYWVVDSIAFEKRFGAPLPF